MRLSVDLYELVSAPGFFYLATPYSGFPDGRDAAWRAAVKLRGDLPMVGVTCYSPIAETHPVAVLCGIDPDDHNIWLPDDMPKLEASTGVIVGKLAGWDRSTGIKREIARCRELGKRLIYLDP